MPRKNNSIFYVGGSVLLIMVAIAATAVVSQTKPTENPTEIRAKAGVGASLKMTGTVSTVDDVGGVVIVNNLQFADNPTKNLGSWTVTPPPGFNLLSAYPGATATITIDPSTFLAANHTVRAVQIIIGK